MSPEEPPPVEGLVDFPHLSHRESDWSDLPVLVTGLGVSGFAAADALAERGAQVTVVDGGSGQQQQRERATVLEMLGVQVLIGPEHVQKLSGPTPAVVVTSPGWRPDQPVLAAAYAQGIPVWGEVELAWRMRSEKSAAPWLTVTGTNGKTTTVQMLASMLSAGGMRAVAAGNVGKPLLEAVLDPEPYDAIAVELSSFQLHYSHSLRPLASCCLNLAPDHLDWHGSMEAYAAAKAKVYANTERACIYNVQDPATERMVREADVQEGCRAIGFTTEVPSRSMVGLVDDVLADRAFIEERGTSAAELGTLSDVQGHSQAPAPPPLVLDALAAAALARAAGVSPAAVREGLRTFTPATHRSTDLGLLDGVRWINDSKATNPHAAQASLAAYEDIVWIAGGQLKGATIDAVIAGVADRLRAVVLLGQDKDEFVQSLQRHAPDIAVSVVAQDDTGTVDQLMDSVVAQAQSQARPGDVVLLAPAAASFDMFAGYEARGAAFTAAVQRLKGAGPADPESGQR